MGRIGLDPARRSPLVAVPAMLVSATFMVWSIWVGAVLWTGGTVPLAGWRVEPSPWASIAWFAVGEWLVFLVVFVVTMAPFFAIERVVATRRARADG